MSITVLTFLDRCMDIASRASASFSYNPVVHPSMLLKLYQKPRKDFFCTSYSVLWYSLVCLTILYLHIIISILKWWAHLDLNQESTDYESGALTVMLWAQELSVLPNPKTNRSRSITQLLLQCNQHLLQNHCTLLIVF